MQLHFLSSMHLVIKKVAVETVGIIMFWSHYLRAANKIFLPVSKRRARPMQVLWKPSRNIPRILTRLGHNHCWLFEHACTFQEVLHVITILVLITKGFIIGAWSLDVLLGDFLPAGSKA